MYKKIVAGYDGTAFSDAALDEAVVLAKDADGEIAVVVAVERNLEMEAMAPELDRKFEEKARADLQRAQERVRSAGIRLVDQEVSMDAPHEAIVAKARDWKSDVIVMGTHGKTGLMRLLMGSTTERVIGSAPCNVLVVRKQ